MANFRNEKIAKIKIAQKQLQMDDTSYRALLLRITEKSSCTKCSDKQLDQVLAEMRRLGFVPATKHRADKPNARPEIQGMINKVEALLASKKLPWVYAHAMAKKMFGKDQVQWLEANELHKLIAALQIAANRRAT